MPSEKLKFAKNPRMVVSQVEQKIDSEAVSKLDRGDVSYYIGSKVLLKKEVKEKYTGRVTSVQEPRLLIMRPDQPSLGSMNLLQLSDEYEFIDFGAFYDENFSSKETHFAVLTRKAKTAAEKLKEEQMIEIDPTKSVSQENLTVFLIKSSDSQIKFSMGLKTDKVIFVDDFSAKKKKTSFLQVEQNDSDHYEESFKPVANKLNELRIL